jgi:hypothetical protein
LGTTSGLAKRSSSTCETPMPPMGELGAVGEQNFVHGHTASIVLFE